MLLDHMGMVNMLVGLILQRTNYFNFMKSGRISFLLGIYFWTMVETNLLKLLYISEGPVMFLQSTTRIDGDCFCVFGLQFVKATPQKPDIFLYFYPLHLNMFRACGFQQCYLKRFKHITSNALLNKCIKRARL